MTDNAHAPTGNKGLDGPRVKNAIERRNTQFGAMLGGAAGAVGAKALSPTKTKAVENVTKDKKVPNPNGKNGGEAHQKTIDKEEAKMKQEGFETQREVMVKTPNGEKSKRFIDLQGKNPKTGQVKQVQVGKQNKNGTPVSRERKAMDDVQNATGKRPEFVPYN